MEPDGRVIEFREKPSELVPGDINAGTYVLDAAHLRAWRPGENVSIEREIFPALIADGRPLFGFLSDAYWLDLGTPEKYLQAHFDILEGRVRGEPEHPAPSVAGSATVDLRAHLGRWVVIGERAEVGPEAQVDDSVVHPRAVIEQGARVVGSIVGPDVRIGAGAVVSGCALAAGVRVAPGAMLEGAKVSAGDSVP